MVIWSLNKLHILRDKSIRTKFVCVSLLGKISELTMKQDIIRHCEVADLSIRRFYILIDDCNLRVMDRSPFVTDLRELGDNVQDLDVMFSPGRVDTIFTILGLEPRLNPCYFIAINNHSLR